jgi:hypothetical protein
MRRFDSSPARVDVLARLLPRAAFFDVDAFASGPQALDSAPRPRAPPGRTSRVADTVDGQCRPQHCATALNSKE